ncbi:MAG: hypothetical protein SGJ21_11890, partial [Alphaproteobacteria bacterium]|nr:hypothetical protein [Alphaproteobacteria bacterium]
VDTLRSFSPDPAPLQWSFVENATVEKAVGVPPTAAGTFVPFVMSATADAGLHRVGLSLPAAETAKSYDFAVWVKAAPGVDALLELAAVDPANALTSYGVSFFDFAAATPMPSPVATAEQQMKGAKLETDGDWTKISGPVLVAAGSSASMVVGMVSAASHVFPGTGAEKLTIGGVSISERQ